MENKSLNVYISFPLFLSLYIYVYGHILYIHYMWPNDFYFNCLNSFCKGEDVHSKIRLHEEHDICVLYLDICRTKPLVAGAERQLLEGHISTILDTVYEHSSALLLFFL